MSIPESHINYIRFARQEIRMANDSVVGEINYAVDALHRKWLENIAGNLNKAEKYINQALQEVNDDRTTSTDTEEATGGTGD
jgi:hypothetical protein